jgi:hypothetical protein
LKRSGELSNRIADNESQFFYFTTVNLGRV